MDFSVALVMVGSSMVAGQDAVQWRIEDGGNGHWYQMRAEEVTISQHRAVADAVSAHFVTITSAEEGVFVDQLRDTTANIAFVTGGYQDVTALDYSEPAGGWVWETGEPMDYMGWGVDYQGIQTPANDSLGTDAEILGIRWQDDTVWTDVDEAIEWGVMLEWSSDCNNDGIVDYGQILDGSLQDYDHDNIPDICEAKQWSEAEGGNGHWYLYQQDTAVGSVCWSEALVRSRSVGGDLVSLTSAEEEDFVRLMNDCLDAPWIGYQGEGLPWSDGEPVVYTNWLSGQPSGDGPYATMTCAPSEAGWNDIGGSSGCWPTLNFWVSEWSADCNNDGIVDFGQILSGTLTDSDLNGIPDQCELGACCLGTACVVALSSSCDAAGGHFSGVGSPCGSIVCEPTVDACPGDITDDGQVDFTDLLVIVSSWGPCSDG